MANRKGLGSLAMGALLIASAIGGGALVSVFGGDLISTGDVSDTEDRLPTQVDGEFDTFQPLQELSTTDLDLTEQTVNESGQIDDSNVVASYDVNTTVGSTQTYAAGVEVDGVGGLNNVDVEMNVPTAVDSDIDLRKAYVVRDVEDNSVEETAATHSFNVEDQEEVDSRITNLADGEYAVVAEMKPVNAGISNDADLLEVDLEGDTDADNEELHYVVDNAQ